MVSKRKFVNGRYSLIRHCGTCGKEFLTTADSPFTRAVHINNKLKNTYYCSESCFIKSYKRNPYEPRKIYVRNEEAKRAYAKEYYQKNKEKICAYQREYRKKIPKNEISRQNHYQYMKRKCLIGGV